MRELACAAILFAILAAGTSPAAAQAEHQSEGDDAVVAVPAESNGIPAADVHGALLAPDPDWQAIYTAAWPASNPVRVSSALPPDVIRRLLLLPGEIHVDAGLDSVSLKIAAFRDRHPAVASGRHEDLVNSTYAFRRFLDTPRSADDVVIVFDATGRTTVNVARAFPDDSFVRDAMTGSTAFVSFGLARFDAHPSGIMLIEEVP